MEKEILKMKKILEIIISARQNIVNITMNM